MVTVIQGSLTPTDTGVDLSGFTNTDVNRVFHNSAQIVQCKFQRMRPSTAYSKNAGGTRTTRTHYTDESYTSVPLSGVASITVGFPSQVSVSSITLYSTSFIPITTFTVKSSFTDSESEYADSGFNISLGTVTYVFDETITPNQYKYTIPFSAVSTKKYFRVSHSTSNAVDNVTELVLQTVTDPIFKYWYMNGAAGDSITLEQDKVYDMCYDKKNDYYYTIRFNDVDGIGTSAAVAFPDSDNFTSVSGTTGFDTNRWTEDTTDTYFVRSISDNKLTYNTNTGDGKLTTTYKMVGNFSAALSTAVTEIHDDVSFFTMSAKDSTNDNVIASIGVTTSGTSVSEGVLFSAYSKNYNNYTDAASLTKVRPIYSNITASGSETWVISFVSGSTWTVSGTSTGAITSASTGQNYLVTNSAAPFDFFINAPSTPAAGERFEIDIVKHYIPGSIASSALTLDRTGSTMTTNAASDTISTDDVYIELYAKTTGSQTFNMSADDYSVSGNGGFPGIYVFTVERVNPVTGAVEETLIQSFDVINVTGKTYNDYRTHVVALTCDYLGPSTPCNLYIKIEDRLYKYALDGGSGLLDVNLVTEDGTGADVSTTGEIPTSDCRSLIWSGATNPISTFLGYIQYDTDTGNLYLRTIDDGNLLANSTYKLLLNASGFSSYNYHFFWNLSDFNTLYYADSSGNLYSFSCDDTLAAFISLDVDDATMPANTGATSNVTAKVISAWGRSLSGKTVTFAVTAGDGAVSPSSDTTDANGLAESQYVVGSSTGTATITATVTET